LVFYSSAITMMQGPINIRLFVMNLLFNNRAFDLRPSDCDVSRCGDITPRL